MDGVENTVGCCLNSNIMHLHIFIVLHDYVSVQIKEWEFYRLLFIAQIGLRTNVCCKIS